MTCAEGGACTRTPAVERPGVIRGMRHRGERLPACHAPSLPPSLVNSLREREKGRHGEREREIERDVETSTHVSKGGR